MFCLTQHRDEEYVEFGLDLHVQACTFIEAGSKSNFTVPLIWRATK